MVVTLPVDRRHGSVRPTRWFTPYGVIPKVIARKTARSSGESARSSLVVAAETLGTTLWHPLVPVLSYRSARILQVPQARFPRHSFRGGLAVETLPHCRTTVDCVRGAAPAVSGLRLRASALGLPSKQLQASDRIQSSGTLQTQHMHPRSRPKIPWNPYHAKFAGGHGL